MGKKQLNSRDDLDIFIKTEDNSDSLKIIIPSRQTVKELSLEECAAPGLINTVAGKDCTPEYCLMLSDGYYCCDIVTLPVMSRKNMQANIKAQIAGHYPDADIVNAQILFEDKSRCTFAVTLVNRVKTQRITSAFAQNGLILKKRMLSGPCKIAYAEGKIEAVKGKNFVVAIIEDGACELVFALKGRYVFSSRIMQIDCLGICSSARLIAQSTLKELPRAVIDKLVVVSNGNENDLAREFSSCTEQGFEYVGFLKGKDFSNKENNSALGIDLLYSMSEKSGVFDLL